MDQVNLDVKYKSQWDQDAAGSHELCGPTSLAMILNYYGLNVTTEEVWTKTGNNGGFITVSQLEAAAQYYKCTPHYEINVSADYVKSLLQKKIPVIALVHAGDLSSRQDTSFTGPHFFVVVGYRSDGWFVNDPDFWAKFRSDGDHHFYTSNDFENAWRDASKDGNLPNSIIWLEPMVPQVTVDAPTYTKLVTKSSNFDKVADYFKFSELQKEDPIGGSIIVTHIQDMDNQIKQYQDELASNQAGSNSQNTVPNTQGGQTTPSNQSVPFYEKDLIQALVNFFANIKGGK